MQELLRHKKQIYDKNYFDKSSTQSYTSNFMLSDKEARLQDFWTLISTIRVRFLWKRTLLIWHNNAASPPSKSHPTGTNVNVIFGYNRRFDPF